MIEIKDFYAPWCMPCKRVVPILEQIEEKYKDTVLITKIDVEKEPELTHKYGVKGVPTIFFEVDGVIRKKLVGGGPASFYFDIIEDILNE